jgi:anaerobic selenocysteine-containing dehydrogenase
MTNPAGFVAKAAGFEAGGALRERAEAIHKAGRGSLFAYRDAKSTPLKEMKAEDFWKALNEGACWVGDAPRAVAPADPAPTAAPEPAEMGDMPLTVVLAEVRGGNLPASPLLSKLREESNLLLGRNRVALNPESARAAGVADGGRADFQTAQGRYPVHVLFDDSIPPGMVAVAATPEVLDMCGGNFRARVAQS